VPGIGKQEKYKPADTFSIDLSRALKPCSSLNYRMNGVAFATEKRGTRAGWAGPLHLPTLRKTKPIVKG
jgi:hypothetical protein